MELKKVVIRIDEGGKEGKEQELAWNPELMVFASADKGVQVQKPVDPARQDQVRIQDSDASQYVAQCHNESGKALRKLCIYNVGNGRTINVRFFYDSATEAAAAGPANEPPPRQPPPPQPPAAPPPPPPVKPPATTEIPMPRRRAAAAGSGGEIPMPTRRASSIAPAGGEIPMPTRKAASAAPPSGGEIPMPTRKAASAAPPSGGEIPMPTRKAASAAPASGSPSDAIPIPPGRPVTPPATNIPPASTGEYPAIGGKIPSLPVLTPEMKRSKPYQDILSNVLNTFSLRLDRLRADLDKLRYIQPPSPDDQVGIQLFPAEIEVRAVVATRMVQIVSTDMQYMEELGRKLQITSPSWVALVHGYKDCLTGYKDLKSKLQEAQKQLSVPVPAPARAAAPEPPIPIPQPARPAKAAPPAASASGPDPKQIAAQKAVIRQIESDFKRLQQNDSENIWLTDRELKGSAEKAAKSLKSGIEKLLGKDSENWDMQGKIIVDGLHYYDENYWLARYTAAKDVLALIAQPPAKTPEPAQKTTASAPTPPVETRPPPASRPAKAVPAADPFIQEKAVQLGALELRVAQELETKLQAAADEKDFGKQLLLLEDIEKNGTAIRTEVMGIQSEFVRKKKDGEQKQRAAQLAGAVSGHVDNAATRRRQIKESDPYKQWALQNDPAFSGAQVQFANGVVTVPNCPMDQCRAITLMVQAMEIVFGRPPKLIQIQSTGQDARKYSAELAITARDAHLQPLAITQTIDSPTQITLKFAVTPEAEQVLVRESPEGRLDALRSELPAALKKAAQVGEEEKFVWFNGPPVAAFRQEFSAVMAAIQGVYGRKPVAAILKTGADDPSGDAQKLNEALGASGLPAEKLFDGRGSDSSDVLLFFDQNEMKLYLRQNTGGKRVTPRPAPATSIGEGVGRRRPAVPALTLPTEPAAASTAPATLIDPKKAAALARAEKEREAAAARAQKLAEAEAEKAAAAAAKAAEEKAAAEEKQRQEAAAKEAAAAKTVRSFGGHAKVFLQQLSEAQYHPDGSLKDTVKEILPALTLLRAKVQGEMTEMQNVASSYPNLQKDADQVTHALTSVMAQMDLTLIANELPVLRLAIEAAVRKTDPSALGKAEADLSRITKHLDELARTNDSDGIKLERQNLGLTRDELAKAHRDVATNLKVYESPEGRRQSMKDRLKLLGGSLQVEAGGKYFWLTTASPDHIEAEAATLLKSAADVFHRPVQSVILRVPDSDKNKYELKIAKTLGGNVRVEIVRDPRLTDMPSVYFFFNEGDMTERFRDLSQQATEARNNQQRIREAEEQQRAAPRNAFNALAQQLGGSAVEEVVRPTDKKKGTEKHVYVAHIQVKDAEAAQKFIQEAAGQLKRVISDQFLIFAHPDIASGLVGGPNSLGLSPVRKDGFVKGSRVFELKPASEGEMYVITTTSHDPISYIGSQFNEKWQTLIPLLQNLGADKRTKLAPAKDTSAEKEAKARRDEIAAREAATEKGIMATRQAPPAELPKPPTPAAVPTPAAPTPTVASAPIPVPAPAPSSAPAAEPAVVAGQPVSLPHVLGLQHVQIKSKDFMALYGYKRGAIEVYSGFLAKKDIASGSLEVRLRAAFANGLEKGARGVYVIYRGQTESGEKNKQLFEEVARKVANDIGIPVNVGYRSYTVISTDPNKPTRPEDEISIILKRDLGVIEKKIYDQYVSYLNTNWGKQ